MGDVLDEFHVTYLVWVLVAGTCEGRASLRVVSMIASLNWDQETSVMRRRSTGSSLKSERDSFTPLRREIALPEF